MQAWLVAVPWGRCPRKGCTRYQYERCFCCDSFKHMIFIQYTWNIWYVQTYADVNFLLSGVCTYTICFSCCIIIFCFYLFSSWSNHKLPLQSYWSLSCEPLTAFLFLFSSFFQCFILFERSEFLIDTSPKNILRVCPCARVHACSTNLGFSVGSANRLRPKQGIPLPV